MITIQMKNVYSRLSDYTIELEKKLTTAYPNYWFSPKFKDGSWDGKMHFLKRRPPKVPTGLLHVVEECFEKNGVEYEIVDKRIRPIDNLNPVHYELLNGIKLRNYQAEAINRGILNDRGIFYMGTGSGKTEVAIGITKVLELPTLFLTHKRRLLHQTRQRYQKRLGQSDIGIIGDEQFEPEKITVATIQSINELMKREEATAKKLLNYFQVVFFDECHHSSSNVWYGIGMYCHNAYFRFGLSGTPLSRDDLSNMKVMALTGNVIFTKKSKGLMEEGYLSDIEVRMIDNPEVIFAKKYSEIYKDGVIRSLQRNVEIVDLAEKHLRLGNKVLILVRQIEHGNILQKMLVNKRHIPAVFLYGKHKNWEREQVEHKFSEWGNFVLIATVGIFGEGVDIPEINVIIIATGGKSEVETVQKAGRGLRKPEDDSKLILYDFIDGSEFLEKHSEERIKVYKKEGFLK